MPKGSKVKLGRMYSSFFPEYELRRREIGSKVKLGWENNMKYSLYSSLMPSTYWDPTGPDDLPDMVHGGIFNLEFSPDGRQLVAACERAAVMIFDPLTHKLIHDVHEAHSSCVNCIKFLDSRVFATCSDDKTVALWDVRNLKRKIRSLKGHRNWVKNIEYSPNDSLLVTSGFDGRILGWNINRYTEEGLYFSELFSMKGLMRMRLTPDAGKLVVCTTGGYMVAIHNLSLGSLKTDLRDFEVSKIPLHSPASLIHMFKRRRNRVELISDFPAGNEAEIIHSLQIHPQGWCALSRNTSLEDKSEWSCVHDIQEVENETEEDSVDNYDSDKDKNKLEEKEENSNITPKGNLTACTSRQRSHRNLQLSVTLSPRVEIMLRSLPQEERSSSGNEEEDFQERESDDEMDIDDLLSSHDEDGLSDGGDEGLGFNIRLRFTSLDMDLFNGSDINNARPDINFRLRGAESSSREEGASTPSSSSGSRTASLNSSINSGPAFSLRSRRDDSSSGGLQDPSPRQQRTHDSQARFLIHTGRSGLQNILVFPAGDSRHSSSGGWHSNDDKYPIACIGRRLINYIEECNQGQGFIKELCFSSDGRLICSPYNSGVRLMMFDNKCSEVSHCVQAKPQKLYPVLTNKGHATCVVSTKFSPTHCLLVSGCLGGKIVWHEPVL